MAFRLIQKEVKKNNNIHTDRRENVVNKWSISDYYDHAVSIPFVLTTHFMNAHQRH